jgi:hypothetical protein
LYRKNIVKKAVLSRFAVTLRAIEDTFAGVLTDFDGDVFVFEDCWTVASSEGASVHKIPGRIFVERKTVAYLQELP